MEQGCGRPPEPGGERRSLWLSPLTEHIRSEARLAYPQECCGILLGYEREGARVVQAMRSCRNERAGERGRYAIDARELIAAQREARARGAAILGFYHSHPDEAAEPSPRDAAEAYWEGCSYVIVSVRGGEAGELRSYALRGGVFEEEQVR